MSKRIYEGREGVTVVQYVGSADLGADRRCFQITAPDGTFVRLTAAQFDDLMRAMVRDGSL